MTVMHDLAKLVEMIVAILVENLKLNDAAVYLREPEPDGQYVLKASGREPAAAATSVKAGPLIQLLEAGKKPVVYEEVKPASGSEGAPGDARAIAGQMAELRAIVLVPIPGGDGLKGFIALGQRQDKGTFSAELVSVLAVLGNQVALAMDNCRLW